MNFEQISYKKHQSSTHETKLVDTWQNCDTVDYWRHERMYRNVRPLIEAYPLAKWLTIGDGRYGNDANYLMCQGADVLATDINDTLLKKASQEGFVKECQAENAENLSFSSEQFDFALCKESYHHFPRPMIALYEMLRVVKKAVVLIEPNDAQIVDPYEMNYNTASFWYFQTIKNIIKVLLHKKQKQYKPKASYESSGNYVYSISRREMEKVALGLNLPAVAFKGLNDFYIDGVEYEKVADGGPLFAQVKNNLKKADAFTQKTQHTGLLVAVLFKSDPSKECVLNLQQNKFNFRWLSRSPYINHG